VCTDLKIPGGDLGPRLEQLAAGHLPGPLAKQADLVRHYRNIGGDERRGIKPEDVTFIRGFLERLLEFLYWAPAKFERAAAAFLEGVATIEGQDRSEAS
jgi:hypothetical protein